MKQCYTKEEIVLLTAMWVGGARASEIGQRIGRSTLSVRRKVRVLGLPLRQRKFADAEDATIMALRRRGYSGREIGKILGRSRVSIISRWQKLGPAIQTPSLPRLRFLEEEAKP